LTDIWIIGIFKIPYIYIGRDTMKSRPLVRILSLTGIIACALNILIIITLDFTVPDYNFITQYVSEFGIIPGLVSKLVTVWWIISGLALMLYSFGLNKALEKSGKLSILGPLFIFMYGLFDSIGSAIFPMDMAEETFSGMMHMLVSFIGITAVIFSPLALLGRIKKDPAWKRFLNFTWVTQIFFFIIYVICVLAFLNICFGQYLGILQRVFIYGADIWIIVLGIKGMRVQAK
jgi:hypothetical protein